MLDLELPRQAHWRDTLSRLNELADVIILDPQWGTEHKWGTTADRPEGGGKIIQNPRRYELPLQSRNEIADLCSAVWNVIKPSGYVLAWSDAGELLSLAGRAPDTTLPALLQAADFVLVDWALWATGRAGLGARTRRNGQPLLICQKPPIKFKGHWHRKDMPLVWHEKVNNRTHTHAKPVGMQKRLIEAACPPEGLVVDPCCGSASSRFATAMAGEGRRWIGGDLLWE